MTDENNLKKCANTSLNYVSFETPSSFVEVGGQRCLIFARKNSGAPCAVASLKDIDAFIASLIENGCADAIPAFKKGDSPSMQAAVDYQKSFILGAFYLMLQDKLYSSHYKTNVIAFNGTELCHALGISGSNRTWAKKAFMTAALIIGAQWVPLKEYHQKFIHIIQKVQEVKGGFEAIIEPDLLPIWEKTPKIEHDIALYKVDFKYYPFAWGIGRKIEEISDHQKRYSVVTVSARTLFNVCKDLPDTYQNPRDYSKRIKWLETNLDHLVSKGVLSKWEWSNGRPACLEDEASKMLLCTLGSERHNLTPEKKPPKSKRTPKKAIKEDP